MGECRVKDIISIMNFIAPEKLAAGFDNTGFTVGDRESVVTGIAMTLDCMEETVDFAIENGCNMIISHHPLIFDPLRSVTTDSPVGRVVYKLIRNGIAFYAAHTNYDRISGGTDDILAAAAGISDAKRLEGDCLDGEPIGFGRIGTLAGITAGELKRRLEKAMGAPVISTADDDRILNAAASCAGAGSSLVAEAARRGAEIFITGEAKYSAVVDAKRMGMDVILCSHQRSEQISLESLKNTLQNRLNGVKYNVSVLMVPFDPLWK